MANQEIVETSMGKFSSVKRLRGELDRVLQDSEGSDIMLKNPVTVNLIQQGDQFLFVRLTVQEQ